MIMNRRQFIKSLAAIGIAFNVPSLPVSTNASAELTNFLESPVTQKDPLCILRLNGVDRSVSSMMINFERDMNERTELEMMTKLYVPSSPRFYADFSSFDDLSDINPFKNVNYEINLKKYGYTQSYSGVAMITDFSVSAERDGLITYSARMYLLASS